LSLVYGLENLVDFLSSCVVLWRFFAPTSVDTVLEQKLKQREGRASIAISFFMVALGMCIMSASFSDLSRGQEDQTVNEKAILLVSFFSILVFGTLSMIKLRYASKLDSPSMYKDGVCSVIGTFLAAALFLNTAIIMRYPTIWWVDPIAAFVAGVAAIVLGVRAIYDAYAVEGLPIFSKNWWLQNEIAIVQKNPNVDDHNDVTDIDLDDHDII
jgi:Co/Zn/Cd efflux system component